MQAGIRTRSYENQRLRRIVQMETAGGRARGRTISTVDGSDLTSLNGTTSAINRNRHVLLRSQSIDDIPVTSSGDTSLARQTPIFFTQTSLDPDMRGRRSNSLNNARDEDRFFLVNETSLRNLGEDLVSGNSETSFDTADMDSSTDLSGTNAKAHDERSGDDKSDNNYLGIQGDHANNKNSIGFPHAVSTVFEESEIDSDKGSVNVPESSTNGDDTTKL